MRILIAFVLVGLQFVAATSSRADEFRLLRTTARSIDGSPKPFCIATRSFRTDKKLPSLMVRHEDGGYKSTLTVLSEKMIRETVRSVAQGKEAKTSCSFLYSIVKENA